MIISEGIKDMLFDVVGKMAEKSDIAKLYWMCLGRLSGQKEYQNKQPGEIHNEILKLAPRSIL